MKHALRIFAIRSLRKMHFLESGAIANGELRPAQLKCEILRHRIWQMFESNIRAFDEKAALPSQFQLSAVGLLLSYTSRGSEMAEDAILPELL